MSQETDHAWAAGFVDGEGSVSIFQRKNNGKSDRPGWLLQVSVGQRVRDPLLFLQALYGGAVSKGPNCRGVNYWQATGHDARGALESMLPHLRVKQKQAKCAIRFASVLRGKNRSKPLTVEEMKVRHGFMEEMRELNRGGRDRPHWRRIRELQEQLYKEAAKR